MTDVGRKSCIVGVSVACFLYSNGPLLFGPIDQAQIVDTRILLQIVARPYEVGTAMANIMGMKTIANKMPR